MRAILCIFFVFLSCSWIRAQQLIFKEMANELHLPSYECYRVLQDRTGYIWISTEHGLCRYNGQSIKVFNQHNGLPEKAVYGMYEDTDGSLRMASQSGRILRIRNDSVLEENYQTALEQLRATRTSHLYFLTRAGNNDYLSTTDHSYRADLRSGEVTCYTAPVYDSVRVGLEINNEQEAPYFIRHCKLILPVYGARDVRLRIRIRQKNGSKDYFLRVGSNGVPDPRIEICKAGGFLFFSVGRYLLRVDADLNVQLTECESGILSLNTDKENQLWVGLLQKGYRHYADVRTMQDPDTGLDGYSVSSVCADRENGLWITTLERGIFYCNNRYVISYNNVPALSKIAHLLKAIGDSVFVSSDMASLHLIKGREIRKIDIPFAAASNNYSDICFYRNHWYVANKAFFMEANASFSEFRLIREPYRNTNVNVCAIDTGIGQVYYSSSSALLQFDGTVCKVRIGEMYRAFRPILFLPPDRLLYADPEYIRHLNLRTGKISTEKNIGARSLKFLRASDGRILIGTKGNGLWSRRGSAYQKFHIPGRHTHDIIFDLCEDAEGTIWASTESGLISIHRWHGIDVMKEYDISNGFPANDMRHIAIAAGMLYVSTVNGLCRVPLDKLTNAVPPALRINTLLVNNEPQTVSEAELVLPYHENSIRVICDVLSYKYESKELLLYHLSGDNSVYKTTTQRELIFDNLAPGAYELTVFALNNDGIKSAQPLTLRFLIEKPYWQRWWFMLACFVVFALIVFLIALGIIRRIRKKEAEKTRINKLLSETQLSALQAQMNPHFIFNAINSIQNYILKHEQKEAFGYLAKFGKLIRMVLNNSREVSLRLDEELEALELYVELEQMRFKNSFTFSLLVDAAVDTFSVYVPAMLIQPYIENAIWHGLMPLDDERPGELRVSISEEGIILRIVIEDNGIGRLRSKELRADKLHRSVGMAITEQRLETIHRMKAYEGLRIAVTDLYDAAGQAAGTRVELVLPIGNDNE